MAGGFRPPCREYDDSVRLTEKILAYVREHGLLPAGERVGAAVSGGADSVAMLRALVELREPLGIVVSVLHFHHGIRGEGADADQRFAASLAEAHGLVFLSERGDAPATARARKLTLEEAARELRYAWFRKLLQEGALDSVATAHTADDQAETVLLRLLRGAGTRGLAGIYPRKQEKQGAVIRPLLTVRRGEVEDYLRGLGQAWREDPMNVDLRHARNRVRHELLPLLEREYSPGIVPVLADTAEIARGEEEFWQEEVARLLSQLAEEATSGLSLDAAALRRQPVAVQRRLLRAAAQAAGLRLSFHHCEEVRSLLAGRGAPSSCDLPEGRQAALLRGRLVFQKRAESAGPAEYEYRLRVPGEVEVTELGTVIRASLVASAAGKAEYNRGRFLEPRKLEPELVVRNWRAGDRFWPAHSKSPKKVKELLAARRVAGPDRRLWPVVASGSEIVWIRGFAGAQAFVASVASDALLIEEVPAGIAERDTTSSPEAGT
ncbi:MAG TPA: tRNA lysidine(34) synthetase TilS [Terriglobales bacterium]|nr:tRNA lysidine(34) synthetase TilS [Terriglobales bacterium]